MKFEFSAGGIVIDKDKVLVVKTKNLKGEFVHTFPKGVIEPKEKAEETALREVIEETGMKCTIIKLLDSTTYWFRKGKDLIKKTVKWYLMKPEKKVGTPNKEILSTEWYNINEVEKILTYASDKQLIKKIQ